MHIYCISFEDFISRYYIWMSLKKKMELCILQCAVCGKLLALVKNFINENRLFLMDSLKTLTFNIVCAQFFFYKSCLSKSLFSLKWMTKYIVLPKLTENKNHIFINTISCILFKKEMKAKLPSYFLILISLIPLLIWNK